jgi:Ankyrin repeats (3 copies)
VCIARSAATAARSKTINNNSYNAASSTSAVLRTEDNSGNNKGTADEHNNTANGAVDDSFMEVDANIIAQADGAITRALFEFMWSRSGNHATFLYLFNKLSQEGKASISEWPDDSWSLLRLAASHERLKTARFLVNECNCNVNKKSGEGFTPLHEAVIGKGPQALQITLFLLDAGADFNVVTKRGECPLSWATAADNTPHALLLLKHGANPNLNRKRAHKESNEQRPRIIDYSILSGNMKLVRALIERGSFVGGSHYPACGTTLNQLLHGSHEKKLSICRFLVSHANNEDDVGIAAFLQSSLVHEIDQADNNNDCTFGIDILLMAGVAPTRQTLTYAVRVLGKQNSSVCQLLADALAPEIRKGKRRRRTKEAEVIIVDDDEVTII